MLEQLFALHDEVLSHVPLSFERYLKKEIHWDAQAICVLGGRGVGKTTLICQYLLESYPKTQAALYVSADNVVVASFSLFAIAQEFFKYGGQALFIDEVHKYPNWSVEIKNIIDTYRDKKLVFSASSAVDLHNSKGDLSRRVAYYELKGLSFREYLSLKGVADVPACSLEDLLENHVKFAKALKPHHMLVQFSDYLQTGYYPFFIEGTQDYIGKVNNIIEKVLYEDITVACNVKQQSIPALKRLLHLVATAKSFIPNVERMSERMGVSRQQVYDYIEYLARAGLLHTLYPDAKGLKLVRKPGKIFMENTNFLVAMCGTLKLDGDVGNLREVFFANQLSKDYRCNIHDQGDFIVDGKTVFEVGGASKDFHQIKDNQDAYLAVDGVEVGFGRKIPLYLFGFLY
jgi:uncharacterized protein